MADVRTLAPWIAPLVVLVGAVGTVALHVGNRDLDTTGVGTEYWISNVLNAVAWSVPGAFIARARPRLPFGWILGGLGVAHVVSALLFEIVVARYDVATPDGAGDAVPYWVASWLWVVVPASVPVILLLFPTGTLPSSRWRPAWWGALGAASVLLLGVALHPGRIAVDEPASLLAGLTNPVGIDAAPVAVAHAVGFPLQGIAAAVALASLLSRYRHADGRVRDQVRWLAIGVATSVVATIGAAILPMPIGIDAPLIILPITGAITVALLRHQLFAIDHVVRRATAYGALLVVLAAVYAVIVAAGGAVLGSGSGTVLGAVAAVVVAVALVPLRDRLQRIVDRVFYGGRRDPYEVIAGIGRRLVEVDEPGAVLPRVANELVETLKLPWVAIESAPGRSVAAGVRPDRDPVAFDLDHHGRRVGRLLIGTRRGEAHLDDEDRRVLRDLAPHLAAAVHAVRLNDDLVRSRQRLVTAREEERRRLRRDLHDGLGPVITGIAMRADAAATLLTTDRVGAARHLEIVSEELRESLDEVRRLVEGLRPVELDQLGLIGALEAHAARVGPRTVVEATALGPLPAAVEVAAYRIVVEALTNVRRHAAASRCHVRLWRETGLHLEVVDDGNGFGRGRSGSLGLPGMRERAEELGGVCRIESRPGGGTAVTACLPIVGAGPPDGEMSP